TSDDPLPEVDEESLAAYHRHLVNHLTFPFEGRYSQETGPFQDTTYAITVLGLHDPDDREDYGLICRARHGKEELDLPLGEVEVGRGNRNRELLADYSYWFWNY